MPGGDGTGPRGFGPMTGRAAGFCTGFGVPGYMSNFPAGRGYRAFGRGRGQGGRGFRNWFYGTGLAGWQRAGNYMPAWGNPLTYSRPYYAPMTPAMTREQELDTLKAQAEYLEDALEGIRKQLEEIEGKAPGSKAG